MSCKPAHSIRKLLVAAAIALGATGAPVLGQAETTMKIGTVTWIGYAPFYVASGLDTYKKYGLKVTMQTFNDGSLILGAIRGGALDGGMVTYDQLLGAAGKGWAQKVVMPIDYSNGGDAIVADKGITQLSQLRNQKIGYGRLTPSDFLLSYALLTSGMSEKDIQPVDMTPESVPAAMASHNIRVGVTYEPSVSQILQLDGGKSFHVLYSSRQAPGLISDVLVFDDKYIKAHHQAVRGLIGAYLDGLAYMKAKPDEANKLIAKAMGITPAEVKEQLAGVYNLSLPEMLKSFTPSSSTASFYASGKVISGILVKKGQIKAAPAIASTLDPSILKTWTK